jgi:phosphomannomutase
MVTALGADGAVVISGSHNPIEWNALKFMGSDGVCLSEAEGQALLDIYYRGGFTAVDWSGLKEVQEDKSASEVHIEKVMANVNVELIRSRRFQVALDSCNGAGSVITPILLEKLGCKVTRVHCTPNGLFPHNPEPTFDHLEDLAETVAAGGFDVGFAQDADADRLAIIDESGRYIGEEYTLVLCVREILSSNAGPVAANLSTSRMIDDVAARFGGRVVRTKVGEANVAAAMMENGCVAGGEGNGGIIDPRTCYTRDSLSGMALVLELLAREKRPVSAIVNDFPPYAISKKKFECARGKVQKALAAVKDSAGAATTNELDGVRLDWPDRWVHVRASNTEPAVRVIAEAPTDKDAEELCGRFLDLAARAAL